MYVFLLDVYAMLKKKEFKQFDRLIRSKPQLLNSLRNSYNDNSSLLMQAAQDGNRDLFRKLLELPQDFGIATRNGWNVFHRIAARQNAEWWFDVLVEKMYNSDELVNKKTTDGATPLHWAARCNNLESIKWLLSHQADFNATDNIGKYPDDLYGCSFETKRMISECRGK